jgi:hypothetical protein
VHDTRIKQEANMEVLDGQVLDRNRQHMSEIKTGINELQNSMFCERERAVWGLKDPPKYKYATNPNFEQMTYR